MTSRSPDEIRRDCVDKMGVQLGGVYYGLFNQCAWLHMNWSDYVELYGVSPARIDLLNTVSASFFGMLDDVIWNDVLLHIARLTDEPRTAQRETLSILRLPTIVDAAARDDVHRRVDEARARAKFARDWRHRKLAHSDLTLAIEKGNAKPLAVASRNLVADSLKAIAQALNAVEGHYFQSEVRYDLAHRDGALMLL
jgi:hypothetical protein